MKSQFKDQNSVFASGSFDEQNWLNLNVFI